MVRLAIRMTSSGRSSYRRLVAKRASFSPRDSSLPSPTRERCVSCAIVIETGTPIPSPAAPTCVRKRRREVRSTSLIILCASVDIPSPGMHDPSQCGAHAIVHFSIRASNRLSALEGSLWHKADVPSVYSFVRFWGRSGRALAFGFAGPVANDLEQTSNDVRSPRCLADCIMTQRGKPDRIPAEFRIGGQAMESVIAKLLQDFEQGKMNRRQLIQSLSLAAAAAAGVAPAARAAGKPLEALYVNHISYEVNDYKKVRDFYVDLLGMKVTEDDGKQCRLVFGNNMLISRNRAGGGPAKVDHIAYTVTNWDAE